MAKKKRESSGVGGEWIVTYSDMVTLMLCFFVALFNPSESDPAVMAAMISSLNSIGMGASTGGNTFSPGQNADLGNTVMALPANDRGTSLGTAINKAQSLFNPEIRSNKVRITHDERGLVITLASDAFFNEASARINIEETRNILLQIGAFLNSSDVLGNNIRIEGHTDDSDIDESGPWESNWELSSARSISVLHFLTDIGVNEKRFQVAGFADTKPIAANRTPDGAPIREGMAYNRRVDIVILDEGHL
ncbi:flagellar motor protein MotB [Spirochaetia bacterium]|nr:flagellar motor protein MotB [Spirochaetia bacterium]